MHVSYSCHEGRSRPKKEYNLGSVKYFSRTYPKAETFSRGYLAGTHLIPDLYMTLRAITTYSAEPQVAMKFSAMDHHGILSTLKEINRKGGQVQCTTHSHGSGGSIRSSRYLSGRCLIALILPSTSNPPTSTKV